MSWTFREVYGRRLTFPNCCIPRYVSRPKAAKRPRPSRSQLRPRYIQKLKPSESCRVLVERHEDDGVMRVDFGIPNIHCEFAKSSKEYMRTSQSFPLKETMVPHRTQSPVDSEQRSDGKGTSCR